KRLAASLGRLSSGYKIVNAKDNPSGLALAKRMNAQIEGVKAANQNAGDGVSIIEVADGAMSEIHAMLQRINELAVKASTGTLTDGDREVVNQEVVQLKAEISRITTDTQFNGQTLLDGSFDLRGFTDNVDAKVAYYSDETDAGLYEIDAMNIQYDANGNIDFIAARDSFQGGTGFPADAKVTQTDGNVVTITGGQGFEIKLEFKAAVTMPLSIEVEGFGSLDKQVGANEGQQMDIRIPKVSLVNMGISSIDLSTEEGARDTITRTDGAIKFISSVRSRLGAYQNRLEHTINSLDITEENMTSAYSRIMDTDMAEEMTEYTNMQVLAQASTSMLAQANERPSQVLQLLQ
ncbi:MAG: flagellin FliC3, partial [Lachnospiraceae bacterium]|nr:flagellin FliC3 [Lachnospiraceae bacterium]